MFSCWHLLDSPLDVSVLNVFAGVPTTGTPLPRWDQITGASDPLTRVRERLEEDHAALVLAGREPKNLDFVEAQYRSEKPTLDEVLPSIREQVAGAAEVFAPAGIGGHPAHCLIRDAGLVLAREGVNVSFYADIPYATEFGWPLWVSGREPNSFIDVDAAWRDAVELIGNRQPRVATLDEPTRQRKVEAMKTYRTQFPALEAGAQRRLTHPELVRFEVVWIQAAS